MEVWALTWFITKMTKSFSNQKAWMNGEVKALSAPKKLFIRSAFNTISKPHSATGYCSSSQTDLRQFIGAPQGCVLSPILFTLYIHDYISRHGEKSAVKFADDTTIIDKTTCWVENDSLSEWCTESNLLLNVSKTKEFFQQ